MSNGPQVTVVIPAYRRQRYILGAVRSVLDSDIDRGTYEIVLVADAVAPELEQRLTSLGVRIVLVDAAAVGETLARGVSAARGAIVAFLDDDDRFHPSKLRAVQQLFADPNVVGFHHGYRRTDDDGNPLGVVSDVAPVRAAFPVPLSRRSAGWVRRKGGFYNCSSIVVRRLALEPNLALLRQVTNAQDFTLLLLLQGPGTVVIDGTQILADFRTHVSQGTHLFRGHELVPDHIRFLAGTVRSFYALQRFAPTEGVRQFARCRTDSYETVLWATTGQLVTAGPSPAFRAVRAVAGNLREGDLRNATVLAALAGRKGLSSDWALRLYIPLKRVELSVLGMTTTDSGPESIAPN